MSVYRLVMVVVFFFSAATLVGCFWCFPITGHGVSELKWNAETLAEVEALEACEDAGGVSYTMETTCDTDGILWYCTAELSCKVVDAII